MIELWPFVNGKALAHGINLSAMEASDMLDVAHYYLESDFKASTPEEAEAHSNMRDVIYESMYNKKYKFSIKKRNRFNFEDDPNLMNPDADDVPKPFDPSNNPNNQTTKKYTPPTPVNPESPSPFGEILDSPMN